MSIERFNSNGRFHAAIKHNGIVYLSGQIATNSDTVAGQTQEILGNLEKTLEIYGSDKKHILSANIYLADTAYFNEFNAVWDAWVEEGYQPVRTCVGSSLAAPKYLVEITLVAALIEV